jgi:hypothetical protein
LAADGHAIAAVEDYLEGPYRIRRRDDTAESRFAITSAISNTKTAISLHQALVEMHAPTAVSDAYNAFVAAAQQDAGPQMTAAGTRSPRELTTRCRSERHTIGQPPTQRAPH